MNYYSLKKGALFARKGNCLPSDGKIRPYYQNLLWLDLCMFVHFIFCCVKKQITQKQQNNKNEQPETTIKYMNILITLNHIHETL